MPNTSQVKKLLRKKGLTGKDVGLLLMASLLNDIEHIDDPEKELLFTQEEIEDMVEHLQTDRDRTVYGAYRTLYNSLVVLYNAGKMVEQRFYHGWYRLYNEINAVRLAEEAQKLSADRPLIMTESQYKRSKDEARAKLREAQESYNTLILYAMDYFLEADEAEIKKKAPSVWEALEATKQTPVTENRYTEYYNYDQGNGYYIYPDGRRSDQMTAEEIANASENEEPAEKGREAWADVAELEELFYNGDPGKIRAFIEAGTGEKTDLTDTELDRALDYCLTFLENVGGEDQKKIDEILDNLDPNCSVFLDALGYNRPRFIADEELPEGTTLYDLLYLYSPENDTAGLKEDAPELFRAVCSFIEENLPQAQGLKANQKNKYIASWGELADADFLYFRSLIEPSDKEIVTLCSEEKIDEAYSEIYKAGHSGIAIIQNPEEDSLDDNGDYRYNDYSEPVNFSLSALNYNEEPIEKIKQAKDVLIYPALAYIYSINALLEILEEVYSIKDLAKIASIDTSDLEDKIDIYNNLLYIVYHTVYGGEDEKRLKRARIKEVFSPLLKEEVTPSEENREDVKNALVKVGTSSTAWRNLNNLEPYINTLTYGD